MLRKRQSNISNITDVKGAGGGGTNNLMRSMDSLDELEESDLENSILKDSDKSLSTPSISDEEEKREEMHDLDKSVDSYGVKIE